MVPNVAVYLLGAEFNEDGTKYDVNVEAQNVSEKGCEIKVGTFNDGNPYSVYVQVVIIPEDRSDIRRLGGSKANG